MCQAVARKSYAQDQLEVKPNMYTYLLVDRLRVECKDLEVEVLLDVICKSTFVVGVTLRLENEGRPII